MDWRAGKGRIFIVKLFNQAGGHVDQGFELCSLIVIVVDVFSAIVEPGKIQLIYVCLLNKGPSIYMDREVVRAGMVNCCNP